MSSFANQWGVSNHFFRVTIGGTVLSFKEVSGLGSETQVAEYRHGDSLNFWNDKRAVQNKYDDLTLKRGQFHSGVELVDMFNEVYDRHYMTTPDGRKDIIVELLDENEEAVVTWNLHNCFPKKISIGGFGSDKNEIAIEEIVFAVESISVEVTG